MNKNKKKLEKIRMKLIIKNKIRLDDLKSGSLFMTSDMKCLALKSEYRTEQGAIEAHIVGSGEMFWGGTHNSKDQWNIEVFEVILEGNVSDSKLYSEADMRESYFTGFNRGIYVASVITRKPIDGDYPTYEQYIEKK